MRISLAIAPLVLALAAGCADAPPSQESAAPPAAAAAPTHEGPLPHEEVWRELSPLIGANKLTGLRGDSVTLLSHPNATSDGGGSRRVIL